MNYEQLKRRVERAERLVEGRSQQTSAHWSALKLAWREGWTPARIVAAGLVSGFVSGRAEPFRALTSARLLQMVSAVAGLFASAQAAFAAEQAEQAAGTAEEAATTTEDAAQAQGAAHAAAARAGAAPAAEPVVTAPRPAEAATELSEH